MTRSEEKRKRFERVICKCCSTTTNHDDDQITINSIPKQKRSRRRRSYSSCLPSDVVEQVLLRLPARSVIKLRLACKLFHTLTTAPQFVSAHTDRCRDRSIIYRRPSDFPFTSLATSLVFEEHIEGKVYLIGAGGRDRIRIKVDDFPTPAPLSSSYLLGAQDGLLYFITDHDTKSPPWIDQNSKSFLFTLFNPLTRQVFSYSYSPKLLGLANTSLISLYYHVPSASYRLLLWCYKERGRYIVLSLGDTTSRRIIEAEPVDVHVYAGVLVVQPNIYVLASTTFCFHETYSIVVFNTETEQFTHQLPVPADCRFDNRGTSVDNKLLEIGGKLCLCRTHYYTDNYPYFRVEMWVLKDSKQGIWIKKSRIIYSKFVHEQLQTYDVLTFMKHSLLLLVNPCDNDIASPKKESTIYFLKDESIDVRKLTCYRTHRMVYQETLASVHMQPQCEEEI